MKWKARFMTTVFLLCCLLVPCVGQASSLSDIVDDDWAYFALAELGRGRPLADFIIPQEMTRYQGARLVARLIEHISGDEPVSSRRFGISREVIIDQMVQDYNLRVAPEQRLNEEQVELLYRLALEFNDELAVLGYDVQDYAIILGLRSSKQLGGLFLDRQLTYSSQALAAVRKANMNTALSSESSPSVFVEFEEPQLPLAEQVADEETVEEERRSLWTGSALPLQRRVLPSSDTLTADVGAAVGELGALSFGGLQVSGTVRASSESTPLEEYPSLERSAGYGLALKYGDLYLSTVRDHYVSDPNDALTETQVASTSLDLSVGLRNSVLFSAGYKYFDPMDGTTDGLDVSAVASLGVEVPITAGGVLRLGMSSAFPRTAGGEQLGSGFPDDNSALSTAELGISYDFENETSLRLNYRLIDFTNVNQSYGATAEFSIKF